jgi:hypothetical protein
MTTSGRVSVEFDRFDSILPRAFIVILHVSKTNIFVNCDMMECGPGVPMLLEGLK